MKSFVSMSPAALAARGVYVHCVPGRLRVEVRGILDHPRRAEYVQARLQQADGVSRVDANPTTGRLLVIFDPAVTSHEALLQTLDNLGEFGRTAYASPRPADHGRLRITPGNTSRVPLGEDHLQPTLGRTSRVPLGEDSHLQPTLGRTSRVPLGEDSRLQPTLGRTSRASLGEDSRLQPTLGRTSRVRAIIEDDSRAARQAPAGLRDNQRRNVPTPGLRDHALTRPLARRAAHVAFKMGAELLIKFLLPEAPLILLAIL